jgi:hypothetical protein
LGIVGFIDSLVIGLQDHAFRPPPHGSRMVKQLIKRGHPKVPSNAAFRIDRAMETMESAGMARKLCLQYPGAV